MIGFRDPLPGMSEINRTIAYAACEKLGSLGYEWDESSRSWIGGGPVRAIIDRLENEYGFTCDAGPLFHCSDWRDLRKLLGIE
jgi:hypothetical protein